MDNRHLPRILHPRGIPRRMPEPTLEDQVQSLAQQIVSKNGRILAENGVGLLITAAEMLRAGGNLRDAQKLMQAVFDIRLVTEKL